MRDISRIIIHCSDSDNPDHDDISVIDRWHKERGWQGVGYHHFIKADGTIQKGRDHETIGAHCRGYNANSIGICLHGRNNFTEIQFRHLANLINHIRKDYDISEIEGHYHYDSHKSCPNFDVSEFKKNYDL
ncbi:MAG: N-acetylmuramoyl-L-alanine amidase [Marinilabiliaceae bacterium]